MKRFIAALLTVIMLATAVIVCPMTASAAFPATSQMGGYENMCLTYTWNPNAENNGRHSVSDLMPYVAYYNKNGEIADFFFDSYLFLPCNTYGTTGASLHYSSSNPTHAEDWTAYIEDTFYAGANVDALNTAYGIAKTSLNEPDKKAGVVFSILYPGRDAGSRFGSLGGRTLNLTKYSDRQYAVKWMIDEQLRLFNEAGYENLELIGFYWLEEYLSKTNTSEDTKLFQYASNYLHSLGLKFVWIPYYNANGYAKWKTLGFDIACYQPNMFWQTTADPDRVANCVSTAKSNGMCVELELDHRVFSDFEYYNRYLDYLAGCLDGGAIDSVKMYYQGGKTGVYYSAWQYNTTVARSIYDLTYKYAKGTLTNADINKYRTSGFDLSPDVDWISIGKSYTASTPYTGDGTIGYHDVDGTELTDGKLGTSAYDTDWHGFHNSLVDADGRMNIVIDLEQKYTDLTNFYVQFSNINDHGISVPADDVTIYISDNGTDFRLLAQPQIQYNGISAYIEYIAEDIAARYVKFSFINNATNFVFCGEAAVGRPLDQSSSGGSENNPGSTENILFGKKYELSGCGETETYNANLTDGYAMGHLKNTPTENWFGFYYNPVALPAVINAPGGIGTVVFDLESRYCVDTVRIHLINSTSWAIGTPEVFCYTSEDGVNWSESVAQFDTLTIQDVGYWAEITGEWNCKYLMVEFVLSDIFAFVNEIEAYGTAIPEEEPTYISGDVNSDGSVDVLDYLLIKRACYEAYILDELQKIIADVDHNGEISSADYLIVKRWAMSN